MGEGLVGRVGHEEMGGQHLLNDGMHTRQGQLHSGEWHVVQLSPAR